MSGDASASSSSAAGPAIAAPRLPRLVRRVVRVVAQFFSLVAAIGVTVLLAAVAALVLRAERAFPGLVGHFAADSGYRVDLGPTHFRAPLRLESDSVVVRDDQGKELFRADAVAALPRLLLDPPYVELALAVRGARVRLGDDPTTADLDDEKQDGLTLPRLPRALLSLIVEDLRVELGPGSTLRLDAELTQPLEGALRLDVSDGAYENEATGDAAEALLGVIELQPVPATKGEPRIDAVVSLGGGALLWGSLLLDFEMHPLRVSSGVARTASGYRLQELHIEGGGLGTVSGTVGLAEDLAPVAIDIQARSTTVASAFATLLRDPLGDIYPWLAAAEIGGRLTATLRQDRLGARWTQAAVKMTSPRLLAAGVELRDVEIDVGWFGSGVRGATARNGRVRASALTVAGVALGSLDLPLRSEVGRLRATAPLVLSAFGGRIVLDGIVVEEGQGTAAAASVPTPRLLAGLRIEDLSLAAIGEAFGWTHLEGRVGGDLGRLEMSAAEVRMDGSVQVETFGGRILLSNLGADDPFGRVPSMRLDAVLSEIDLLRATAALPFGRVSGVLEGSVIGLVLADGQPQAFDADLRTVSRSGVKQSIDVRAIVQLSVLGGSDDSSAMASVLRFFDEYRYSALGLRCRLRRDTFEIRGIVREGSREYLVKGSLLPPSVNVISHSQVVSFSEMLKRVRRIAAIGEGGSPDAVP